MAKNATTNVIKSTILIVVVLLLIAGIYFSLKRITERVPQAPVENQFVNDLEETVDNMVRLIDGLGKEPTSKELNELGDEYNAFSDKIGFYYKEHLINGQEYEAAYDNMCGKFGTNYANFYCVWFNDKDRRWTDDDIKNTRTIVNDLRKRNNISDPVRELADIISLYDSVSRFLNDSTVCKSIKEGEMRIAKAKKYAERKYLKNNLELCKRLNNMPAILGENHFHYLEKQINLLNVSHLRKNIDANPSKKQDIINLWYNNIDQVSFDIKDYQEKYDSIYGKNAPNAAQLYELQETNKRQGARYIKKIS